MLQSTAYFARVAEVLTRLPAGQIDRIAQVLLDARRDGRKIFLMGNGGSSANASHIVNDLVKSAVGPAGERFKAICLSDNTPLLTAYANDVSYDIVFSEPLAALAEPGDVVIALSGSGNSPNVIRAMEVARDKGLTRIGLTGRDGGKLAPLCDIPVIVPTESMQIIEDLHLVILHAVFLQICDGKEYE